MPQPIPSVFLPAQGVASASSSRMSSASSGSAPSIAGGSRQRRLRRPRSIAELADLAEAGVKAMPFSSSIPVHRYLAGAENLIRQADAYSSQWQAPASISPSDRWVLLEDEWVCLVKAARLLVEILPSKHSGWSKLDAGARTKAKQTAESALERIGKLKVIANDEFEAWRTAHPDASLDDDPEEPPDKPTTTDRVPESKPKRSPAGSGGFDVRDLLGTSPFTSSPLEPFSASHSKMPSSGSSSTKAQRDSALAAARTAARIPEKYSYPVLKATNTYRMSAHQATQGFAASTSLAGSYYAAPSATSSDGAPAQSTIRPQSSAQKPPIPSKYELKPGIPTKTSAPGPRPLPLPGQSLASRPPLPTPTPAPAHQPAPSGGLRASMPHEASLRNLHAYERKPRPGDASLTRSQSRIALDVQDLLLQQQAGGASAKSRSSIDAAASTARTEGGEALRTLRIPASIIDHFVAIADENTRANRETCGLLMGPQRFLSDGSSAALVVTHLTIPKQSATADTCTTEHEEEIMEYQEREGLVTLGWIHTHPSQTCFMSSLDLHTHSSYQMMLPEAVAIVCAPNDNPSFGLFRLTSPPGLQTIVDCREPGLFHPHVKADGSNIAALYTDAWGHAKLDAAGDLEIVDLRRRR